MIRLSLILTLLVLSLFNACGQRPVNKDIILATTTSFQDSGLLEVLKDKFNKESGYNLKPIAVGSGEAMAMGKRGDADILVVHSPKDEEVFMQEGLGKARYPLMYNDFVILGPTDDPAGCLAVKSVIDALNKIATTQSPFISRGDNSGTHKKEMSLWKEAGIDPTKWLAIRSPQGVGWYIQAGVGMGEILNIANEKKCYTISDRGTYLVLKNKIALKIVSEGDTLLRNPYSVIILNPEKYPKINLKGAQAFADFLLSTPIQNLIAELGKDKYGEPLFYTYPKK